MVCYTRFCAHLSLVHEYFTRVQPVCFVCITYYFPTGYIFNRFPPPFIQKFNYPFAWF